MSADGHAVEGAFGFQIGESSLPVGNEVVSSVVGSQGDDPLPGRVAGVGRYISYAALALLFGLFVLNIVSRRLRLSIVGGVGAVSVLVVLLMTGPNTLSGSFTDAFDVSLLADTMNTRSGTMMVARILFFVAIAIVGSRMPRRMLGLILVLLAGTFAAGGHSGSESPVAIAVLVTTVHVIAVSIWIGGIIAVLVGGATSNLECGVQRFAKIMNFVLPAVVLSGVLTAARNLGGLSGLFDSTYGKITITKFLLVVAMGVLALIVRRKLQGSTQPKKVLAAEAAFGLAAFVLASVLAVTPPISASGTVFQRTAVEAGLVANVTVDPVGTGANEIHVLFSPPGGALSRVGDVTIRYSLPERSVPNLDATVSEASPNHWIGVLNFPYTGIWKVEVFAKPTSNDTVRFVFEVAIGG
jgi:copper transport protein